MKIVATQKQVTMRCYDLEWKLPRSETESTPGLIAYCDQATNHCVKLHSSIVASHPRQPLVLTVSSWLLGCFLQGGDRKIGDPVEHPKMPD